MPVSNLLKCFDRFSFSKITELSLYYWSFFNMKIFHFYFMILFMLSYLSISNLEFSNSLVLTNCFIKNYSKHSKRSLLYGMTAIAVQNEMFFDTTAIATQLCIYRRRSTSLLSRVQWHHDSCRCNPIKGAELIKI